MPESSTYEVSTDWGSLRLLPLREFGRERETVDLSKVVLTHHTLRSGGKQPLNLAADGTYKLPPLDAVGSVHVQNEQQAHVAEIIERDSLALLM